MKDGVMSEVRRRKAQGRGKVDKKGKKRREGENGVR